MKTFQLEHSRAHRCRPLFPSMPVQISLPMQQLLEDWPSLIAKYGRSASEDVQVAKQLEQLVAASEAAFNLYFGIPNANGESNMITL
jgi:hypothetical protein